MIRKPVRSQVSATCAAVAFLARASPSKNGPMSMVGTARGVIIGRIYSGSGGARKLCIDNPLICRVAGDQAAGNQRGLEAQVGRGWQIRLARPQAGGAV